MTAPHNLKRVDRPRRRLIHLLPAFGRKLGRFIVTAIVVICGLYALLSIALIVTALSMGKSL